MGKNIVVIGTGVGGAASAALLARAGHRVTVLEAHDFPGGRCTSFERDGFLYDFGVHMFSRGDRGPHGEVNRRLASGLKWRTSDPACRVMGKVEFDFPLDIRPLSRQIYLARKLGIRLKNLPGVFRLFRILMGGRENGATDGMTVEAFVSRYTADENIHLFLNCISQLYFAISYTEASAGEFIWSFSRMFKDAAFGYPKGGSIEIPRRFLAALEQYGGKIHYRQAVEQIQIENGAVRGVKTAAGTYPADMVVANCGVNLALELAGREHFPQSYLQKVDGFRYTNPYVTIKYALARPVIPYPVVFYMPDLPARTLFRYTAEKEVPEDPYLFMPIPSNMDPGLAPDGRQLVIAGTAAPPGASGELCRAILEKVHQRVCRLFPTLEKAILWRHHAVASDIQGITRKSFGETIGVAQTPDQVGALRLGLATPVEGLWLVGADAGARGIGTEMAADSALALAETLTREARP